MSESDAVDADKVERGDWVEYRHPRSGTKVEAKVTAETDVGYQLDNGAVIDEEHIESGEVEVQD